MKDLCQAKRSILLQKIATKSKDPHLQKITLCQRFPHKRSLLPKRSHAKDTPMKGPLLQKIAPKTIKTSHYERSSAKYSTRKRSLPAKDSYKIYPKQNDPQCCGAGARAGSGGFFDEPEPEPGAEKI
jgi:hypothetical protein